jgi:hypothetical protein
VGFGGRYPVSRRLILAALLLFCAIDRACASDFVNFGVRASVSSGGMFLPTVGLQALYSMVQQKGYNGPCMTVTRASDSTLKTVGFVNGYCDVATAFTFGGGTTLSCTTFYDQSGSGLNLPNCGSLNSTDITNGIQGITNDFGTILLPAGLSFNRQSETAVAIASTMDAGTGALFQLGSVLFSSVTGVQQINESDVLFVGTGPGFVQSGLYGPTTNPVVAIATSGSSGMTFYENNKSSALLATQPSGTETGGYAFSASSSFSFYGSYYLLAIYNTVLSPSQISSIRSQLYRNFNVVSAPTVRFVDDGDSITEGTCATFSNNRPHYMSMLTTFPIEIRDIGVYGQQGTVGLANETQNIIDSYDPTMTNIVEFAYGTNDLAAGTTAANIFTSETLPYVANAQTKGYKVIVATLIYRTDESAGFETQREAYNALVRSNAATYGYTVADYDTIPQLQNPQTGGYSCDGTHPLSPGYALMGVVEANAINTLLP